MIFGGLNLAEFFTSPTWQPTSEVHPQYGILALMAGSLSVTVLAIVLAMPLGLGAPFIFRNLPAEKARRF